VQQQHLDQRAGARAVTTVSPSLDPEAIVLGSEQALLAGLGERGRAGKPGLRARTSR
jgi:hypothetical protein